MASDLLQQAKQGDPRAIATLINHRLQPRGIRCKTSLQNGCLKVLLESANVPDKTFYGPYIYKGVIQLGLRINRLQVSGRKTAESLPAWIGEYFIEHQPQPIKPVVPKPIAKGKPKQIPLSYKINKTKAKSGWIPRSSVAVAIALISIPTLSVLAFFFARSLTILEGTVSKDMPQQTPMEAPKPVTTLIPVVRKTRSPEYPSTWNMQPHPGISQALTRNMITGCPQYRWKQHNNHSDQYLVQCSKNGKNWLSYNVWPNTKKVLYEPDIK